MVRRQGSVTQVLLLASMKRVKSVAYVRLRRELKPEAEEEEEGKEYLHSIV